MRYKTMGMLLLSIFAVFFIAYAVLALGLYFMQSHFVYSPVRQVEYTPGDLGLDFEDVNFEAEDGVKLNGWYIPSARRPDLRRETQGQAGSEFTVLFCHGNGGNIMHRLDSINIFYELGLSCFIFDYRGYGRSEGQPSEAGTYLDAMAAYKWLREKKKAPPSDIIILGKSLGGCIAAELAGKVDVAGLVLESAFTSYVDIGRKFYPYMPVRWFAKYSYSTIDYVKKVEFPVMIIHSRNDELVPFEFGVELFEAANEPKEFVEISGSHNDGFLTSSDTYNSAWMEWVRFLKKYKNKSSQQSS